MPAASKYPYQTVVLVEPEIGDWIDEVSTTDGMSKAHVVRLALGAGRLTWEASDDPDSQLVEDPPRYGVSRYTSQTVPRLSAAYGEWLDSVAKAKGVDKSLLVRVLLRLGMKTVEKQRRAARRIAA